MNSFDGATVLKRWGFYFQNRLAYAGIAVRAGAMRIGVRFFETEHHPHMSSLPERMSHEQLVRKQVCADLQREFGSEADPVFRFEPIRCSESRLAQAVFGRLTAAPMTEN